MGAEASCCTKRENDGALIGGAPGQSDTFADEAVEGPTKWKVTNVDGFVYVRSARNSDDDNVLGTKQQGDIVLGFKEDNWIKLSDQPGIMMISNKKGKQMLEPCEEPPPVEAEEQPGEASNTAPPEEEPAEANDVVGTESLKAPLLRKVDATTSANPSTKCWICDGQNTAEDQKEVERETTVNIKSERNHRKAVCFIGLLALAAVAVAMFFSLGSHHRHSPPPDSHQGDASAAVSMAAVGFLAKESEALVLDAHMAPPLGP